MKRRGTIIGMIIMVCVLGTGEVKGGNEPVDSPLSGLPVFYEPPKRIIPEPPEVGQPILEEQIDQTEKLLLWLEELWKDEEARETIGEERLSEFISSVTSALTNPPAQGEQTLESTAEGGSMGTRGDPLGISEIPGDTVINANTVWDEDVHLNGKVYVDNAMLVIMPGVEVRNDPNGGIIVQNNGVITAKGLPNDAITFISDAQATNEDYDFAIKIEETALSASTISYCNIQHAAKGIYIANNKLENPLENNKIENCYDAIVQYGPELTDIYNNLITNSSDDGIEISLAGPSYPPDPNGASNTTQINIEHNLINGSSYGVTVWGVDGPDEAGTVVMKNNILAGCSQYAIYQSGWMATIRLSNGYYANSEIGRPQTDTLPVYLDEDPFVNGMETPPFVIIQDCNLVDAAYTYDEITYVISEENIANIDLIGMSTSENGFPDSGVADIGFHYPNWSYSNVKLTLSADIDSDSVVDANDLQILSENWLCVTDPNVADPNFIDTRADLNGDDFVDFKDFALLSAEWLNIGGVGFTDIQPTFDGDTNNLTGYVSLSVTIPDPNIYRVFTLVDGKKHREIDDLKDFSNIGLHTERFTNGPHYVKMIGLDINGNVICSLRTEINFNNTLSSVTRAKGFIPGADFHFYALGSEAETYLLELYDSYSESIVYSNTFEGTIAASIPSTAFVNAQRVYELKINKQNPLVEGMPPTMESSDDELEVVITKQFNINDYPQGCGLRAVASIGNESVGINKAKCWKAFVKLCIQKGYKVVVLRYEDCTWRNLKHLLMLEGLWAWHHSAHGNDQLLEDTWLEQPQRTCVTIKGDKLFSFLDKDYPGMYPKLSSWYEDNPSVAELGLANSGKMKFVRINACESAKYSDFAAEMGMFSDSNLEIPPIGDQTFLGWKDFVPEIDWKPSFIKKRQYSAWEEDLFKYLQNDTLWDAINNAIAEDHTNRDVILEKIRWWGGCLYWKFRPQQ